MRKVGKIATIAALLIVTAGCNKQVETVYVDSTTPTTNIRVWGIAQFYHVVHGDEVQSYYVGGYDVSDTIDIKVPAGKDSVTVGAENMRGIMWQKVKVVKDSLYRFKTM